ncbi:MAG: hypothetical protein HZC37_12655 [Burkholderiales bacterium]|nr:hypothetical protein [Burkholderiales bacterium]
MPSKRPIVLMGILLVMVLGYAAQPLWAPYLAGETVERLRPLPGDSRISSLSVRQDGHGRWLADVEYFFNGSAHGAAFQVHLQRPGGSTPAAGAIATLAGGKAAERGSHRISIEIRRPHSVHEALTTERVVVQFFVKGQVVAREERTQRIDWPDWETWAQDQEWVGKPREDVLRHAARLIDSDERHALAEARRLLERLLARDPDYAAGYIEMARVAMKTNWGPEGLHQAETLLSSALRIQADSVNAKILLGYVYAHQGRHKESEKLLVESAAAGTQNQWLWVNWGELLEMQGKTDAAIEKYRIVTATPRTDDVQDRPRLAAHRYLLRLLEKRRDVDGMGSLLRQRATEFGEGSCHGLAYARFLLTQRGDAPTAMAAARRALDGQCNAGETRDVLGMAHYALWASGEGVQREASLNQARIFLPAGPRQMYLLATSDSTARALQALIAGGERIDRHDNEKHSALAHALYAGDHAAARRLVRLGARLDSLVGADDLPVALLPVVTRDFAAIRLMQQLGVDYTKVRHRGLTALDHARQSGDRKLLQALDPRSGSL